LVRTLGCNALNLTLGKTGRLGGLTDAVCKC